MGKLASGDSHNLGICIIWRTSALVRSIGEEVELCSVVPLSEMNGRNDMNGGEKCQLVEMDGICPKLYPQF